MRPSEVSGPDLAGVVGVATQEGLEYVVIGGFSVIFHGFVRATRDSDLLIPDGPEATSALLRVCERAEGRLVPGGEVVDGALAERENLRVLTRFGLVDFLRGGEPPLDFETVSASAVEADWEGASIRVASLASLVGFKRLARRPLDQVDLAELESIHGELPVQRIPGLDD